MEKTTSHDIDHELIDIAAQLLSESGEHYRRNITLDSSLQRNLGIDSLGRAELFRRVEKAFDVSLPDRLLAQAETLEDIAKYLRESESGGKRPARKSTVKKHGDKSLIDVSHSHTLLDVLLRHGEGSPDKAYVFFQNEDGEEEIISYGELLKRSLQLAQGLRERGLKEGETVAIMQPTHPGFFYTFFGTLLAGGVPVPIYPPFRMHMLEEYAKTEARILNNAEVRILVTFHQAETLSRLLQTFVPSLKHVVTVSDLMQTEELKHPFLARADNFAFIQYTSGSTSDPKGVLLTHQNLLANIRAYGKSIHVSSDDVAVSWLPLYHDMGLIGMLFGSLFYGVPLVLMTPFSFLNHPERWLWAIHYHRGTISAAPNFAYELCVRKLDASQLEGLDLSSWRIAADGAEKVYPRTLEQFAEKFAKYGFDRKALMPVYGLAESSVALTIPPLNREFRIDHVNRKKFEEDRIAEPDNDKSSLEFVACGKPMEGHYIRILDDDGRELPERHVGNLQFQGPSSMQGYYHNPRATAAVYHDGWIDTGDLAYIADGELFITGRRKDLIIKAGRNLYPAEIEELVGAVEGVRQGCVTAFGHTNGKNATEELVVVAETREKNKARREKITEEINSVIASALDIVPDSVVLVAPHIVPKTSSGKLQRAACKKMYEQGKLHRLQMPAWMQVVKLGWEGVLRKSISLLGGLGKVLYTVYAALVFIFLLLPMYFAAVFATRETLARTCRRCARTALALLFCPMKVIDEEKLNAAAPMIFAPNHASYFDAVVVLALMPLNTRVVAKKELFNVPFLRTFLRKLDYVPVDRVDLSKGLEDTRHLEKTLKAGNSILIFPEGTFGYASGLRPFRLGAFKISTETGVPICPVAIKGTRRILRDDEKIMRPKRITVTVCDPVSPAGKEWENVTQLRNDVRAVIARHCGEPSLDFIAAQTVATKD